MPGSTPATLNPTVAKVTQRIRERSAERRALYERRMADQHKRGVHRAELSCGNLAHGFAACSAQEKDSLKLMNSANLGIISSYNDMLSAHQPFETFPETIKAAARAMGSTAQFAGGVPAMCDGVTQGQPGMELSLFSRDVIAMATAVGLSHNMFDAALYLGVCDKIVPGLFIGAARFGHLPAMFVPAGPMPSGLPNKEKARIRQLYAEGKVGREELLQAESDSYHSPGTCTFYGTANSNQLMMEVMGLHLPGTSFVNPGTEMREALTRYATEQAIRNTEPGGEYRPFYKQIDERAIVNAVVGLLLAWVITRYRFPGRRLMDALVDLPFALPTAVAGLTLSALFAANGWLGQWFEAIGISVAYTPLGIMIAMSFTSLPFVVRAVQPVLEDLTPDVEEAAATLGATPMATFTRVILAQLMPALLTGTALAFTRSLGEYGAVIFIAGNMPFETEILSLLVNIRLDEFDYAAASALASVILIASLVLLFGIQLVQSRLTRRWKGH